MLKSVDTPSVFKGKIPNEDAIYLYLVLIYRNRHVCPQTTLKGITVPHFGRAVPTASRQGVSAATATASR